MFSKKAQILGRNLQTAGMDEASASVWKATTDDLFEAKGKHVLAVVRWAAEAEMHPALSAALVKRVQTCGSRPVTASKTLFLLHSVALAGADAPLAPALSELSALLQRGGLPAETLDYASYLCALCEWDDAGLFRNLDAPAFWRGMHLSQVLGGLAPLQLLLESALSLALDDRAVATPADAALRLAVAQDAFALFRCETAAAAVLWDGLLALPPEVAARHPGGALEALQTASRHAADALMLQRALGSWRGGTGPLSGLQQLDDVLQHQLPWSEARAQRVAAAAAAAGAAASAVAMGHGPPPAISVSSPREPSGELAQRGSNPPPAVSSSPASVSPQVASPPAPMRPHASASAPASQSNSSSSSSAAAGPPMPPPQARPVVSTKEIAISTALPAPPHLALTPSALQRRGSWGNARAEWQRDGLLPPAPVAPAPMHAPLAFEMSDAQLRLAAYEGLLLAASAGPGGGTGATAGASGADESTLATVRTRLGLSLRAHRRLLPLLRADDRAAARRLATDFPGGAAHRARLLLAARPSGGGGGSAACSAEDVRSFGERQLALLCNALAGRGMYLSI